MSYVSRNCKQCNNYDEIKKYCTLCNSLFCNNCQCFEHKAKIEFQIGKVNFSDKSQLNDILGKDLGDDVFNLLNSATSHSVEQIHDFGNVQWECTTCTLYNSPAKKSCSSCDIPRQMPENPEKKLRESETEVIEKLIKYDLDDSKISLEYAFENSLDLDYNDCVSYKVWSQSKYSDKLNQLYDEFITQEIKKIYPQKFLSNVNGNIKEDDLNIDQVSDFFIRPRKISSEQLWGSIFKLRTAADAKLERMIITEMEMEDQSQISLLKELVSNEEMYELILEQKSKDYLDLVMLGSSLKMSQDINDIYDYFKHECMLCCGTYPSGMMRSMLTCEHELCRKCFRQNAISIIQTQGPTEWLCSLCNPEDHQRVDHQMYYGHLKQILELDLSYFRSINEKEQMKLITTTLSTFEIKLLDDKLQHDDTFLYCPYDDCDNGFVLEDVERVACPKCHRDFCGKCRRKWDKNHQNRNCDETELFILGNDFENLFKDLGIECPNCNRRYALAAGGCLHFDCKCHKSFCGACYNFFTDGECSIKGCKMTGFHAHHPRNCLYYLRDNEENDLEQMLANVDYARLNQPEITACRLIITDEIKKDDKKIWIDKPCGVNTVRNSGYCSTHYREYLVKQINMNKIDPVDFYNDSEKLNLVLFQSQLPKLKKNGNEEPADFCNRIRKEIKTKTKFYVPKFVQNIDRLNASKTKEN